MVITKEWYSLVPYVTKKKDKLKKLEELKKTKPNATLSDVVESKHVRYEMKTNCAKSKTTSKDTKNKILAISQADLENKVYEALRNIRITEDTYDIYVARVKEELENETTKIETQRSIINMSLWKLRKDRDEFISNWMFHDFKNEKEEELYNKKVDEFNKSERRLFDELDSLSDTQRNKMVEFQMFAKLLKNIDGSYKKAKKVRKKKNDAFINFEHYHR